jgi:ATP-binding cassette subfamily B protein
VADTKSSTAARESSDSSSIAIYDGRLIRRIFSFLLPYKGWVILAFIITLAVSFLGPLRPKLVQVGIDQYILTNDGEGLQRIILLLLLALVGEGLLSFANKYLTRWIGQQAIYDLRVKIFSHIQRLPLRHFDRTPIGRLITRTTSDVEALNDVFSAGVITMLGDLFRLGFIAFFMFSLHWQLAVVTLLVMPLMVYATFLFRRKVRSAYRDTREQISRLNSFLQEHVSGMAVVQLFNREKEEKKRFEEINDDHRQAHIRTILYYALFWPTVDILSSLALGLVLWVGGLQGMTGSLSLGVLVAFIQYVRQFFRPIRNLSDQYNTLQKAMAASERIFDLLDLEIALPVEEEPIKLEQVRGHIEFRNVWFTYDDPQTTEDPEWVLKGVTFTVELGESVAIVGATGAGKTTIINLLLRFYEINDGQILVDGIDIRKLALRDLRQHIGLVLQDVFLFSGSVRDNITLGDASRSGEDVERAARLSGAYQFIDKLPGGYDYDVRERGGSLSMGQRQLISFVRAMVYDPEILVLDEATSSVDTETEEAIQDATDRLMEGRTSLVIAHRLSTIQHADQILVIHKGEIRQQGSHADLLGEEGLYRKLYELQYKEQERIRA